VLDLCNFISKAGTDDVRWEKVKQFKLILTNTPYAVPPGQVAARVIDQMLERGRLHLRRRKIKLSRKTNDNSTIGEAGLEA
jgi:hypothetical protein